MELKFSDKEIFDEKTKESLKERGYQVDETISKIKNERKIMAEIFSILKRENYTVRNSIKLLNELSDKIEDLGMNANLNV